MALGGHQTSTRSCCCPTKSGGSGHSFWAQPFPVIESKFPALRTVFPVNPSRKLLAKRLQGVFRHAIGFERSKIVKFPAKFPVSREFAQRRARSALHRQRGSRIEPSPSHFRRNRLSCSASIDAARNELANSLSWFGLTFYSTKRTIE